MKNMKNHSQSPEYNERDSSYGQDTQQRKQNMKIKKVSPYKKTNKLNGTDIV